MTLGEIPTVLRSVDKRDLPGDHVYFIPDLPTFCQSHYRINDKREFLNFCKEVGANCRNNVQIGLATFIPIFDFRGVAKIRALFRGPNGDRKALIDLKWEDPADTPKIYTVTYLLDEGIFRDAASVARKGSTATSGGFSPYVGSIPNCFIWEVGKQLFRPV